MKARSIVMLLVAWLMMSSPAFGQQLKSWWFFAPREMAERKMIPMSELSACLLGEDSPPGIRGKFKRIVDGGVQTQPGLIRRKLCDVGLILNLLPEEDKNLANDYPGYAIYKIAGNNLELHIFPADIKYVAVANLKFAASQTLLKKDLKACGTTALQRLFAPTNSIWKENWSTWQAPIKDLKAENNPINFDAYDIWIMSVDDHKVFVKRVGIKHPVFDILPDRDELIRRK
ncbi:MAG TPA: hypothetical protein PLP07_10335 [Pyrinomonadaceae bacterium]|nr:hypothetical protein [Chloracidobacterium sp.]MBP9935391.1 hypothetical protein [Pyrinomonadaceae bacterium]MBK7803557.1 hypothetical protein [Chloracidobacterium sp.]MBK9438803.1 hypothetical protein [Chloracidobacterium sp.]MBL0241328.1 hypothetical protein [Chloracidobacterium sp.]